MRSSKMSLNSNSMKAELSFAFHAYCLDLDITGKPNQNSTFGSRNIAILVLLKTIKYKGNRILLLAVTKNEY